MMNHALKQPEYEAKSDEYIFSHIFGSQQFWRATLALESDPMAPKMFGSFNPQHPRQVKVKATAREDGSFGFGIGLDYGGEVVLNTVVAEDDADWLTFSNHTKLLKAQQSKAIPLASQRTKKLPSDLSDTLPPFWTFTTETVSRWTKWENVPLLINNWTGAVLAIIHHNAYRDELKGLRETGWSQVWFQRHARTLLDAHIYSPVVPIATSGYSKTEMREWWPYEIEKGGASDGAKSWDESGSWIRFDEICRDCHEEVFRDGKGPWILPENH